MQIAFTAWGYGVTWLELASVVLALVGIALGIKGTRWAWPPYFLASLLYAVLFWQYDLKGSALLQTVFMAAAVWGWFGWGEQGVREPLMVSARGRLLLAVGLVAGWLVAAPLLRAIGGVATWTDAFILVGSLVAQVLMVREYVEAWPLWVLVNVVAVVQYASQGLWFTAGFYGVLIAMAVVGWLAWLERARPGALQRVGAAA